MLKKDKQKKYRRHKRVRAKVSGTAKKPRLCVSRTSKHIYAQLINDEERRTVASVSDLKFKKSKAKALDAKKKVVKSAKIEIAFKVGKLIAEKALEKKITRVVFDRGGYQYHGRVKAVAEGAREEGLKF